MKKHWFFLILAFVTIHTSGQQTIHVPGDYQSIQDGINASNNGDTVLVDEGTYNENIFFYGKKITVASKFLIDGEESHIENTTIDGGSASGNDYASVVHFNGGEDTTSVLMGFTIINGEGYQNRWGGGIMVYKSGARIVSNHIRNCKLLSSQSSGAGIFASGHEDGNNYFIIIENNLIEGDSAFCVEDNGAFGGGIYIQTMNARIKGNVIKNNLTNGGMFCVGGGIACYGYYKNQVVEIIENEIYGNKCEGTNNIGGGIFVFNCIAHIIDNHIYSNATKGEEHIFSFAQGGGISLERVNEGSVISGNLIEKNKCTNGNFQNWAGGLQIYCPDSVIESLNHVFVDGNTFRKNKALWGAGSFAWRSNVSYTNNFFDDNYAQEYGGAIYLAGKLYDTEAICIINNTFYSNASVSSGASIYSNMKGGNILLMNNLHWKNLGADEVTVGIASLEMYNCNIETDSINGEWEGSQNFKKDPMLISGYVLSGNSPCKNRGIEDVQAFGKTFYAPLHDIHRINRPQENYTDVGAFELSYAKTDTLAFQEILRLYKVYLPVGYDKSANLPVLINLHGMDRDAQYQMDWTGMNVLADSMGFMVVYPQAIDNSWNARMDGDIDDVGFINALIDDLYAKYAIDTDRVYVCGYAWGGLMTSTLACQLSDRITAIAVVSGGIGDNMYNLCNIPRKMPVLAMHGTDDDEIDYADAQEMISFWNTHNQCELFGTESLPNPDPTDGCSVEKITYIDASDQCKVLMYAIENGGHASWPGGNWKPDTTVNMNMDINANLEIWNFFKQYRLSDFIADVPEINSLNFITLSYPNPFTSSTTIHYKLTQPETVRITFYNQFGMLVDVIEEIQQQGLNKIVWTPENLADGVYYFRIAIGWMEEREQVTSEKLIKLN